MIIITFDEPTTLQECDRYGNIIKGKEYSTPIEGKFFIEVSLDGKASKSFRVNDNDHIITVRADGSNIHYNGYSHIQRVPATLLQCGSKDSVCNTIEVLNRDVRGEAIFSIEECEIKNAVWIDERGDKRVCELGEAIMSEEKEYINCEVEVANEL